jgi:hypothetical protein
MDPKAFFVKNRANLLAGVLAVGLLCAGGIALLREQGVATVFLMLGGFSALMFLEYRRATGAG